MEIQPPNHHPAERRSLERSDLLELYRIAIEEYRFNVRLGWDRAQYYLILNTVILGIGTGLVKVSGVPTVLVAAILGIGSVSCVHAVKAIRKSHEYYRAAIYKKTLIEHLLGLTLPLATAEVPGATLALATTPGMMQVDEILKHPVKWIQRPLGRGSITRHLVGLLQLIGIVDLLGFGMLVASAIAGG